VLAVPPPALAREAGRGLRGWAFVIADWTQALFFKREIVSLWSVHEPFKEFAEAANLSPPA